MNDEHSVALAIVWTCA